MSNNILLDLFGETFYLSTQVRIILTLNIIASFLVNKHGMKIIDKVFEYFYFPLIVTLIGHIVLDYRDYNKIKSDRTNIIRIIYKIILILYILYFTDTTLTYEGLFMGILILYLYQLTYGFKKVYQVDNKLLFIGFIVSIIITLILDNLKLNILL